MESNLYEKTNPHVKTSSRKLKTPDKSAIECQPIQATFNILEEGDREEPTNMTNNNIVPANSSQICQHENLSAKKQFTTKYFQDTGSEIEPLAPYIMTDANNEISEISAPQITINFH